MNTPISFELAKLLKEKGFDVPVRNYYLQKEKGNYLHEGFEDNYWGDNKIVNWNKDVIGIKPFKGFVSAPTIAEVVMWLYEKHGIWCYSYSVAPFVNEDENYPKIVWLSKIQKYKEFDMFISKDNELAINHHKSLTEAYEAAIEHALKNLIK